MTWFLNRHSLCSEVFSAEFADLDGNVTLHIIANIYSKYDRRSSEIYLEIWHQFNRNPHFVIRATGSRSKFNYVGPGGLRVPCLLACAMRSLAIVITIVQSFSLSFFLLFSPFFAFDPLRGISHVRNNFSPNILA